MKWEIKKGTKAVKIEIEGEIETIIYYNETNSYTIARMLAEDEIITIVGYLPFVNIGDTLVVIRGIYNTQRLWGTIQSRYI